MTTDQVQPCLPACIDAILLHCNLFLQALQTRGVGQQSSDKFASSQLVLCCAPYQQGPRPSEPVCTGKVGGERHLNSRLLHLLLSSVCTALMSKTSVRSTSVLVPDAHETDDPATTYVPLANSNNPVNSE